MPLLLSSNSKSKPVCLSFVSCVCECKCLRGCVCMNGVCMCVHRQVRGLPPWPRPSRTSRGRSQTDSMKSKVTWKLPYWRNISYVSLHASSHTQTYTSSFWTGIHTRHCTSNLLCCWVYRPNVCWQLIGSCWWKTVQAGFAFPQAAVSTTERFPVPRIPLVSSQRKALKLCHG